MESVATGKSKPFRWEHTHGVDLGLGAHHAGRQGVNARADHTYVLVELVVVGRLRAAHVEPPVTGEVALVEHGAVRTQEAVLLFIVAHPKRLKENKRNQIPRRTNVF